MNEPAVIAFVAPLPIFMLCCVKKLFREKISFWLAEKKNRIWLLPLSCTFYYLLVLQAAGRLDGLIFARALLYFFLPTRLIQWQTQRDTRRSFGMFEFIVLAFIAAVPSWGWIPNFSLMPPSIDVLMFKLPACGWITAIYLFLVFYYWKHADLGSDWNVRINDLPLVATWFAIIAAMILPIAIPVHFVNLGLGTVLNTKWWLILINGAGVFLATALPEELIFRGYVQNLLMKRLPGFAGLFASSLIFGLAHITHSLQNSARSFSAPNWWYVLFATLAGIGYGWVYKKTGSIVLSALVHTTVDFSWIMFLMN